MSDPGAARLPQNMLEPPPPGETGRELSASEAIGVMQVLVREATATPRGRIHFSGIKRVGKHFIATAELFDLRDAGRRPLEIHVRIERHRLKSLRDMATAALEERPTKNKSNRQHRR